jgi:hypothetical protein
LNSGTKSWSYLVERVRPGELLLEEGEALLGDLQDLVGVEVLAERGPAVHPERDRAAGRALPRLVADDVVRPPHSAVMYGDMRGVVSKTQRETPAVATVVGGPAGSLDTTSQCDCVVTAKENVAFRSGWSKQAYARLASAASNWV